LVELVIVLASLSVILAMLGQIVLRVQKDYLSQRQLMEAKNNARVTMDMIIRLVRLAGYDPHDIITQPIVDPDPDGNAQWDSIHLRADWNPPDGALDDPFEDVRFSTQSGSLFTKEPGDPPGGVEFLKGIESLAFSSPAGPRNPSLHGCGFLGRCPGLERLKIQGSSLFIQYPCAFFSLFSHSFLPHLLSHNLRAGSAC